MKMNRLFTTTPQRRSVAWLVALVASAVVPSAHSQFVALSHNNATALVDTTSGAGAGMLNWTVDGTDHLAQQWFWYRVGLVGGEATIDTISAPGIVTPNARTLQLTYANLSLNIRVDYLLTGGTPGSGQSTLTESVTVLNLSGAPMDFHFFQYSDFDLNSLPGGDTLSLGLNLSGKFNEAVQSKGGFIFSETAVAPGADRGQAALFPGIIASLTDGAPTTLSNFAGPIGPGDATWAFQWDVTIPTGGSFTLSKLKEITVVPEPTTASLALLGLGLIPMLRRNRRRVLLRG